METSSNLFKETKMTIKFENGVPSELKVITMHNHKAKWSMAVAIKVNSDIMHIMVDNKHDIMSKYAQIINMLFSMYDENNICYTRMDLIKAVASKELFINKYAGVIEKFVHRMEALPMPAKCLRKGGVRKMIKMPK